MLSVLHRQYHACWCSGDFRSQGISRHHIGPTKLEYSVSSMWRVNSPLQRQAIIWTYIGIFFSNPFETNSSENWIKMLQCHILIWNCHHKMTAFLSWPQCTKIMEIQYSPLTHWGLNEMPEILQVALLDYILFDEDVCISIKTLLFFFLTHWGWMIHICISNLYHHWFR